MDNKLSKKYGLFTAICMVVGTVIGSGVFFKAQDILKITGGNMGIGVASWLVGGAIMLVCLLTFSFMAQKYERVNGIVDYAEALMGKGYAYYIGWFMFTIYYPAMTSVLAWVSARYTLEFLVSVNPDFPLLIPAAQGGCIVGPECVILMLFYLCMSYAMNTLSPKIAGKFQTTTTVIKLIPLALMAVGGVLYGLLSPSHLLVDNFVASGTVSGGTANILLSAVVATAFAYEGWIIATSINAELVDAKKNLPRALVIGGVVIICTYIFYFLGVAGGETVDKLISNGATTAFTNIFGGLLGNILSLFIAISCLGTLNGLMVACTRGVYSLAARGEGLNPETFSHVDPKTNMPGNSAIVGLALCAAWGLYFFLANIAGTWSGVFVFDSSEIPIITIYAMYIPIFIMWMIKSKDENVARRFILPLLALAGSAFMIYACIVKHGMGNVWYIIVFAVVMAIGSRFALRAKKY